MVAQSLDIDTEQVLPFSTGVIGQPLPMQCFRDNIAKLSTRLASDHLSQVALRLSGFNIGKNKT
jgi:glutamate N-acetyltransferase/amino-acid N-acetyltransferase